MDLMTTAEAAAYLRLKERKLYELVATGGIPCTKMTGKWLFPKGELDRWLAAGMAPVAGLPPGAPPPIVGGSTDPLLEWALRESGAGLASLAVGSEAGLARFLAGEVVAAAIHLHALTDGGVDANVEAMRARADFADAVLIGFVAREQGLAVAAGNPLGLATVADAKAAGARMAMRQPGAGAQLLLAALLHRAGATPDALAAGPVCATGADLAQAVRSGRADCGIASRAVAEAAGLSFVPLTWERFDLVMRQHDYFRPPLQRLMAFVAAPAFRERAAEIGGYALAEAGKVRWVA